MGAIRWCVGLFAVVALFASTIDVARADELQVRVSAGTDDAEECASERSVYLNSTDLELVTDSSWGCFGPQVIGLRFQGVTIPRGSTITRANLQFTVDEVDGGRTSLVVRGQAADDAPTFTAESGNVSSRPRTSASVIWADIAPWYSPGNAGASQRSPDLASIVQEIVDREGWSSGNALALIITGSGERTAESFDGSPGGAPLLDIEFEPGEGGNRTPIADAGSDVRTVDSGDDGVEAVSLDGSASRDPDGEIVAYEWVLEGAVVGTTASITIDLAPGEHALTLTVTDDQGATDADVVDVVVERPLQSEFTPFDEVDVQSEYELDGEGINVDSIAFWEAPNPFETLMFVTGKYNDLVEVWEYPFEGTELPPILFPTTANGVVVDQKNDRLHVVESGVARVTVFSLPDLVELYQYGEGILGYGENNIDLLDHENGQTLAYVTDINTVYVFDAETGELLNQWSPTGTASIETVLCDDEYQIIYVPDESGSNGIFAYHSDGTPYEKNGTSEFARGDFQADKEGIILYRCPSGDGSGLIIVSDQTDPINEYEVYDRETWEHLGLFRVPGVQHTDGIASTQVALPDYPLGVFAAIDNDSTTAIVDWRAIIDATGLVCSVSGNVPPSANAGSDHVVTDVDGNGEESVTFDGSGSADADGSIVSYVWRSAGTVLGSTPVLEVELPLGTHVVELTVEDDEGATGTDFVVVQVVPLVTTQSVRVSSSWDDAEECASDRTMYMDSTDLELVTDSSWGCLGPQFVGMRFRNLLVPKGATITRATLRFTVDEDDYGRTDLEIHGEASDNALGFTPTVRNISDRPTTNAAVSWTDVPFWSGAGSSGASQAAPDLAAIVQEIVDRDGWAQGNALVLVITGDGERTAESYDGSPSQAPVLEIEWRTN